MQTVHASAQYWKPHIQQKIVREQEAVAIKRCKQKEKTVTIVNEFLKLVWNKVVCLCKMFKILLAKRFYKMLLYHKGKMFNKWVMSWWNAYLYNKKKQKKGLP